MATFDINNRVAVVTGASRGIGKAVSKALVEQGACVVIGDLLDKEGLQTVQELNSSRNEKVAAFIHTDVTVYKDVIALFRFAESVFGGVDVSSTLYYYAHTKTRVTHASTTRLHFSMPAKLMMPITSFFLWMVCLFV